MELLEISQQKYISKTERFQHSMFGNTYVLTCVGKATFSTKKNVNLKT